MPKNKQPMELEGVLETAAEVQKTQDEAARIDEVIANIRSRYNDSLELTTESSKQIGENATVISMGDTQKKIEEVMQSLGEMAPEDSMLGRLALRFLPEKFVRRRMGAHEAGKVKTSNVAEICENLVGVLTSKYDRVDEAMGRLETLHNDIVRANDDLMVIKNELEAQSEDLEGFTPRQRARLLSLKSEVMMQKEYHANNIVTSAGALRTAEATMSKLTEALPSIRSNINNGIAIRAVLKDITNFSSAIDSVMEISEAVREDNMRVMGTELVKAIESSSITDKQIKAISDAQKSRLKIQEDVSKALLRANERRELGVKRLGDMSVEISEENLLGYKVEQHKER